MTSENEHVEFIKWNTNMLEYLNIPQRRDEHNFTQLYCHQLIYAKGKYACHCIHIRASGFIAIKSAVRLLFQPSMCCCMTFIEHTAPSLCSHQLLVWILAVCVECQSRLKLLRLQCFIINHLWRRIVRLLCSRACVSEWVSDAERVLSCCRLYFTLDFRFYVFRINFHLSQGRDIRIYVY